MRRFLFMTLLGLWSFPGAPGEGVVEADGVSMDGDTAGALRRSLAPCTSNRGGFTQ